MLLWLFAITRTRCERVFPLLCSLISRLPGELVITGLMPTREVGIPAHLGLFYLIGQRSGKVLFFMWIDTFTAMPGAFLCSVQKSLSPSYEKPTVVASSTGAEPKWEFRHASSSAEVQSHSLLAEKSMQTSITLGRHRDKGVKIASQSRQDFSSWLHS